MIHPAPRPKHDGITRAALDREEERSAIYRRDGGRCQSCGKRLAWSEFTLAHRIAETRANIHRWGWDVINHPLNKCVTCPGGCNDAQNIGNDPGEREPLLDRIFAEIDKEKEA